MRSITWKLTLAFLAVGILGTGLVALVINLRAQREFSTFVTRGYEQNLVRQLTMYYQATNSWDNIGPILDRQIRANPEKNYVEEALANNPGRRRFNGLLVDPSGLILVGNDEHPPGTQLREGKLRHTKAIIVNEEIVARLLLTPPTDLLQDPLERFFLQRFSSALLWGILGGTALALILGALLARTLTQPLQELKAATQSIAAGDLGRQVSIRSKDEIGELADSFNSMSRQLQSANQLKKQMTADIAHDLRTPLSVILGYTEALHDGKLNGSPDMYEVLHRQAQHLSHLVEDLRTLSLADAGELPLNRQTTSPTLLLDQVLMAHRGKSAEQQVTLFVDAPDRLPQIDVDPERMMQVLGNLIGNALKHTTAGDKIQLKAHVDQQQLYLAVEDNGHGISPEDIPNIFNRFYRADRTRSQEGASGLGLPIAKSIVEAHGGTIQVESTLGQGSVFTVVFPLHSHAPL